MLHLEEILSGIMFPGIIAHELGHILFCKLTGVKIKKYSLFRPLYPLGYVVHLKPKTVLAEFLIAMGPLFFNTIASLMLFYSMQYINMPYNLITLWLAYSIAYNSFPSMQDGKSLYQSTRNSIRKGKIYNVIYLPFVYVIYKSQTQTLLRSLLYPLIILGIAATIP